MAPSKAAVVNGQHQVIKTDSEKFAPSVWGDFFVTYVPPISQVYLYML
jgi:hypothetical protein